MNSNFNCLNICFGSAITFDETINDFNRLKMCNNWKFMAYGANENDVTFSYVCN